MAHHAHQHRDGAKRHEEGEHAGEDWPATDSPPVGGGFAKLEDARSAIAGMPSRKAKRAASGRSNPKRAGRRHGDARAAYAGNDGDGLGQADDQGGRQSHAGHGAGRQAKAVAEIKRIPKTMAFQATSSGMPRT